MKSKHKCPVAVSNQNSSRSQFSEVFTIPQPTHPWQQSFTPSSVETKSGEVSWEMHTVKYNMGGVRRGNIHRGRACDQLSFRNVWKGFGPWRFGWAGSVLCCSSVNTEEAQNGFTEITAKFEWDLEIYSPLRPKHSIHSSIEILLSPSSSQYFMKFRPHFLSCFLLCISFLNSFNSFRSRIWEKIDEMISATRMKQPLILRKFVLHNIIIIPFSKSQNLKLNSYQRNTCNSVTNLCITDEVNKFIPHRFFIPYLCLYFI